MRKRLLAVALGFTLMASITACGGDKGGTKPSSAGEKEQSKELDARKLYEDVMKKNESLQALDMNLETTMTFSQGEESLDIGSDMDMKIKGYHTDSLEYFSDSTTTMQGQEVPVTLFYKDGYYYMEASGQKIKYLYNLEDMVAQVEGSLGTTSIDVNSLKNITAEEKGDDILLKFEADPAQMNDYLTSAFQSMGELVDSAAAELKSITGTYTLDSDGFYKTAEINMDMSMSMEGETVDVTSKVLCTVNATDDQVSITYPDDMDAYTEVDASLIAGQ